MKRYTIIILSLLSALSLRAQTSDMSLLIPHDVQGAGRSGFAATAAESAVSDHKIDFYATYGVWAPESVDNVIMGASIAAKVGKRLALTLDARQIADSEPSYGVNELGAPTGEFTPKNLILGVGAAYRILPELAVGARAKMLNSQLAKDISGSLIAVDAEIAYRIGPLTAELGAANVGSRAAYAMLGAEWSHNGLRASAELDYLFSGAIMASLGAEYGIKDMVFLRAGYHYSDPARAIPSFASCGLGLKFFGVKLNAAYLLGSETLGGTMLFGLGYEF